MGSVLLRSVVRCSLLVRPEKGHEKDREFAALTRNENPLLCLSLSLNLVFLLLPNPRPQPPDPSRRLDLSLHLVILWSLPRTWTRSVGTKNRSPSSGTLFRPLTVEWPGGISPPGSPRTGHEPLDSSGSYYPAE